MTSEPRRWDVSVYNEATAFIIASRSLAGKGFGSDDAAWKRAIKARTLLPILLWQDDSFIMRVVLGGALDEDESAEAVARLETTLVVADELCISGGIELILEGEEFARDMTAIVPVPAGRYRAVLLSYLTGVNGEACLKAAGGNPETLRQWFQATRPGSEEPRWLQDELDDTDYVDFLLHLVPLDDQAPLDKKLPPLDDGFVPFAAGARRPQACPRGLVARDLIGRRDRPPEATPYIAPYIAPVGATQALVLTGRAATFSHGDMTVGLVPRDQLAALDADLERAGFSPLGDLTCSKLPQMVLRAYVHASGDAYGVYTVGPRRLELFDVVSLLADGSRLTTSTFNGDRVVTDPARKTFKFRHPELSISAQAGNATALRQHHERELATLVRDHGPPVPAPRTLDGVAQALDDAFVLARAPTR